MEFELEQIRVLPAYLFFTVFGGCQKCSDPKTACGNCKSPLKYRIEAYRQPYFSVMVETTSIYLELFDVERMKPESIPYSTLFMAYTGLLHYFMIIFNPNVEKKVVSLSNRLNARIFRFYHIWQKHLNQFKIDIDNIYKINDAVEGRRAVLQQMERILLIAVAYMQFINRKSDNTEALEQKIKDIYLIEKPPMKVYDFSSESNNKFNQARMAHITNEEYQKQMDICKQIMNR